MKYLILLFFCTPVFAQTYVITNSKGEVITSVQIKGNQAQVVNNLGYVTENLTIYPNQSVTPSGIAIGKPMYTIPPSPPSVPSVRVIQ